MINKPITEYTDEDMLDLIHVNVDAVVVVDKTIRKYRAMFRDGIFKSFIDDEGDYSELIQKLWLHFNDSSEEIVENYKAFTDYYGNFKGKYSRRLTLFLEGETTPHIAQMTVYPIKDTDKCVIVMDELDDDEYPDRIRGYSSHMDILYELREGKRLTLRQFDSKELYPGYVHEEGRSNLYIFAPMNYLNFIIGYIAIKNMPKLLYDLELGSFIKNMNAQLFSMRRHIFSKRVNAPSHLHGAQERGAQEDLHDGCPYGPVQPYGLRESLIRFHHDTEESE